MARLLSNPAVSLPSETGPHPIPVGRAVSVIRVPPDRDAFIEGVAVIQRRCEQPHHYLVEFTGDPVLRQRPVHPDYQHDPHRLLSILSDLRRAERDGVNIPDFFPETASDYRRA